MSQPLIFSFRPDAAAMCLEGTKTRTRRIYDPNTHMLFSGPSIEEITRVALYRHFGTPAARLVWSVGSSIAIKPKRTACAVGRVMCVGLRVEHVQDITEEEARAEGMTRVHPSSTLWQGKADGPVFLTSREAFENVWRRLNPRGPNSWDANPLVVVIEMRPLKVGEE